MALRAGLDLPIANPLDSELTREIHAANLLLGRDRDGLVYIDRIGKTAADKPVMAKPAKRLSPGEALSECVIKGDRENILTHLDRVLEKGMSPNDVNENHLIPALLEVGRRFDRKEYYLPQVILAAEAMQVAFRQVKSLLPKEDASLVRGKVVLATVKGDVHDIGKNIVSAILETHGYQIIDLGKNVECELIVETALKADADIVGLSALMTTTMTEMDRVVRRLKKSGARAGVIIGGAVTTRSFADTIGADGYAQDAMSAVPELKAIMEKVRP
jgi:5-methyltetrahydrofolate--homocysteine methyltransferase